MPRFYCDVPLISGSALDLPPGAARHVQVLRLQPGDGITLFGGDACDPLAGQGEFAATIVRMGRSDVQVQVGAYQALAREPACSVHLAVGMPANERMDWVVEKATELGVASIQPLMTQRSVLRLSGERADKKVAHWQSVAIAASEQCGGNRVPKVHPVAQLSHWLAQPAPVNALLLAFHPNAQHIATLPTPKTGSAYTVLCGPEGGLSPDEDTVALAKGFTPITLGPRVLRAETAALAALVQLISLA